MTKPSTRNVGKGWALRSHPPGTLQKAVLFFETPLPLACLPQSRARAVSVQTVWVSSQHLSSDGVRRSLNRTRCRPTCHPNVASLHSHQHHLELAMSVSVRRVPPWIPHFCFIGVIAHRLHQHVGGILLSRDLADLEEGSVEGPLDTHLDLWRTLSRASLPQWPWFCRPRSRNLNSYPRSPPRVTTAKPSAAALTRA